MRKGVVGSKLSSPTATSATITISASFESDKQSTPPCVLLPWDEMAAFELDTMDELAAAPAANDESTPIVSLFIHIYYDHKFKLNVQVLLCIRI